MVVVVVLVVVVVVVVGGGVVGVDVCGVVALMTHCVLPEDTCLLTGSA